MSEADRRKNDKNQPTLTPKDIKRYVNKGFSKCPFCKSDDIQGDSIEVDGHSVWQEIECMNCQAEWTDIYTLTNMEVRSGPDREEDF
mgnify:CR=1 FL=1